MRLPIIFCTPGHAKLWFLQIFSLMDASTFKGLQWIKEVTLETEVGPFTTAYINLWNPEHYQDDDDEENEYVSEYFSSGLRLLSPLYINKALKILCSIYMVFNHIFSIITICHIFKGFSSASSASVVE